MIEKYLWANVCVQCYTTSNLKDICISGNSEGNQVRCYSLRITPQNASKRRRNLEEIDSSYLCCETSNVFW